MQDSSHKTIPFDPSDQRKFDRLIKFAIGPRPICLASTIDAEGYVNLSPFSYFNIFSHNPPVCVFSPVRRMRDGTTKHTLENLRQVPEVVINIVNYAMVQQQSLASTEFDFRINEFEKAGFEPLASEIVRPPRVAVSPVQLECKVTQIIDLGQQPGNGSLVLAEILRMHIREEQLDGKGELSQAGLDLVARLGEGWYCRVTEANLFEVPKPLAEIGIGVDNLPTEIRNSRILTGNHLGLLGNSKAVPSDQEVAEFAQNSEIVALFEEGHDREALRTILHEKAARSLDKGEISQAWLYLRLKCEEC